MRNILAKIIFLVHVAIVLTWWGLFFFPLSRWPEKIIFHFYLTMIIVTHQIIWGLLITPWMGKFRIVCILTTLTQLLRGQSLADDKNYDHSFTREILGKVGIKGLPHRFSAMMAFVILIIVSIQYFSQ
ncbi:MAG: hypothetical protein A2175_00310 [Candidatus Nealsonbacteria bacterium RBG_13_42_11]|uniref:Uncharacterized protein n=1 Tax=Candidatus Nealsonbacteria bacterium RBG_13_42_11 TaxID=1801663 RepID=A0A1G2DYQ5_9BACT|nr:MAG: hypothetical protein A2175_00310 [Candidatus Nealsonbacteria bacterium RBG_13_42_11]